MSVYYSTTSRRYDNYVAALLDTTSAFAASGITKINRMLFLLIDLCATITLLAGIEPDHWFGLKLKICWKHSKLDAGPGFEPGMHRAYETGVVASLPAIFVIVIFVSGNHQTP